MDYIDKYSISVCTKKQITAQEVYDMIFSDYPPLVRLLFNIRNKIVKRFGLKASNGFNDLITENSTNHTQIEKDDRHLFLEIKIECGELVKSEQAISICTSVKFHNALGRIYFFFIKPFHKLLCRMALNKIKMSEVNVGGR